MLPSSNKFVFQHSQPLSDQNRCGSIFCPAIHQITRPGYTCGPDREESLSVQGGGSPALTGDPLQPLLSDRRRAGSSGAPLSLPWQGVLSSVFYDPSLLPSFDCRFVRRSDRKKEGLIKRKTTYDSICLIACLPACPAMGLPSLDSPGNSCSLVRLASCGLGLRKAVQLTVSQLYNQGSNSSISSGSSALLCSLLELFSFY